MSSEAEANAKAGCIIVIIAIVLFVFLGLIGSSIPYGDGHRDGQVQKLSCKGFLFKTYEGELAVAGIKFNKSGGGNAWEFSVTDQKVYQTLEDLPPEAHVRLHYHQYCATLPWLGSTTYRVTRVEILRGKD